MENKLIIEKRIIELINNHDNFNSVNLSLDEYICEHIPPDTTAIEYVSSIVWELKQKGIIVEDVVGMLLRNNIAREYYIKIKKILEENYGIKFIKCK